MFPWDLYHGTSEHRYTQLLANGFHLSGPRFRNWLAPDAVYLVVNRPRVALRFAEERASEDDSAPVVLNVALTWPDYAKVLDLTSDEGMNLLFEAHEGNRKKLRERRTRNAGSTTNQPSPSDQAEYDASVDRADRDMCDLLQAARDEWHRDSTSVNWDTLAIQSMFLALEFSVLIAAIQEGTTFNRLFARTEPRYRNVPNYRGIRIRDHIELCVTDLSLIDKTHTVVVPAAHLEASVNPRFLKILTAPLLPDGDDS